MAVAGGRRGVDLAGADELSVCPASIGAIPKKVLASNERWLRVCRLNLAANVIPSRLWNRSAESTAVRSCRRACNDPGRACGRLAAEARLAEAANAQAKQSSTEALIAHLKLEIEKLRRTLYGSRSERSARLLDQLELQLEELEAAATEDELAAEQGGRKDADGALVRAQAAGAPAFSRRHRARARRPAGSDAMSVLRLGAAVEARRERHLDAGRDPAPVQGDRHGAREVHLPGLRDDHAAAGAVPCDAARLYRAAASGDDPVRQVRPTSAAKPAEPALQMRGDRSVGLDAGRPGWRRRLSPSGRSSN